MSTPDKKTTLSLSQVKLLTPSWVFPNYPRWVKRENPNAPNRRTKVVCVYTYDCRDETDLRRIREALRSIGITQRIPYKTDMDTIEGKYVVRGDRRISKYYE